MPKIIDYEAKRREIADQAAAVLARDGLLEANLGKIADLCGMGRTTLYQYFPNIGALVDFTLADTFARLKLGAEAILQDSSLRPADRLISLMQYLERVAILDKDRMVMVLDFLLHPRRETPGVTFDVQEHVRMLRGELEKMLEQAIASGEIIRIDARSMAFTLFAFVEASTVHGALYDNISLEDSMRDIKLLIEGLRTERG
jgi:AcrR family transcriptional regulator